MRTAAFLLVLAALPGAARAGETACWFEAGVVVAPAEVLGVAGDYVFDTGAPHTLLADTPAQGAGLSETALRGRVRVAGLDLADQPVAVAKLDARFAKLPTPVAGVIGADLLAPYVVEVRFSPCRLSVEPPGGRDSGRWETTLPLSWAGGRPTVPATVSDGPRARAGAFAPSTGSDAAVRLGDDLAGVPGAAKPEALYPYGAARARLRALAFAGSLFENLPGGLLPRDAAAGEIGGPVLSRFRLRFDFPAGRLQLSHEKGPPDRAGGP